MFIFILSLMKFYFNYFIILLFLLFHSENYSAIKSSTLVVTDNSKVMISALDYRDHIASLDTDLREYSTSKLQYKIKVPISEYYEIYVNNNVIFCSGNQKFYDPVNKIWIFASDITTFNFFLSKTSGIVPCKNIIKKFSLEEIFFYELSLKFPHTFFISEDEILTHNIIPIVIALSISFGEGAVVLNGIGVGLGLIGLGLWKGFGKSNQITFAQMEELCLESSTGNFSPEDPEDNNEDDQKVNNMKEFFETDFGQDIEKKVEKTNRRYQGQPIYKVTEKIPEYGLKKGDYFYLDALHKNHIEVFDKYNKFKSIYKMNGVRDFAKEIMAFGRKLP